MVPDDAPRLLGKPIVTITCVDANLYHDLISGKSMTGILHMWNKTVIDTHCKLTIITTRLDEKSIG